MKVRTMASIVVTVVVMSCIASNPVAAHNCEFEDHPGNTLVSPTGAKRHETALARYKRTGDKREYHASITYIALQDIGRCIRTLYYDLERLKKNLGVLHEKMNNIKD